MNVYRIECQGCARIGRVVVAENIPTLSQAWREINRLSNDTDANFEYDVKAWYLIDSDQVQRATLPNKG
jgi:hypothetical protein